MKALTDRQMAVLEFIVSHLEEGISPPTLREIASHLGMRGTLGAAKHLAALERKGYIRRSAASARGITLVGRGGTVSLPVVGTVQAGTPHVPLEEVGEYLAIDRSLAQAGTAFFLRVRGDSMINAAIREGDLALVRPQQTAETRDIVVALVNGEATLKRFYRERKHIRLQPENPNMEPIIVREGEGEVTIIGKVIGIYRQLE